MEPSDYHGLQLDTRAKDNRNKSVDPRKAFIAEVEAKELGGRPSCTSAASTVDPPLGAGEKRTCGLPRRYFWIILTGVLIIVILAAVIGGVVGASRRDTSIPAPSSTSSGGVAPPNVTDAGTEPEPRSNVMVDSPLAMLAYARSGTDRNSTNGTSLDDQQSIRLFYQSANGNIKWTGYDGLLAPWRDATPIFTDAINNTGLCVFTYLNGTEQSFAVFYIGVNGLVQEKRASLSQTTFLPHTLNSLNLKPAAATSIPRQTSTGAPKNNWDSYRMAVAYSTNFYDGPGARLFYHVLAENGTTWVQEMIWNQNLDFWSQGAMLSAPWPSSRLVAVIDETGRSLRLFYSAGNLTLQESYLDIRDANSTYKTGVTIPNLLAHDDADIAAVAVNGDVLVYHYSNQSTLSIRELKISGISGTTKSNSTQESYNLAQVKTVAQPALVADGQPSLYQPIGAVPTNASGAEPRIYVSWAEQNTGANSSYGAMTVVSRKVGDSNWPNSSYGEGQGQVAVPLGTYNVNPSS